MKKDAGAEYGTVRYWDAALAHWTHAVERQPNLALGAFKSFADSKRWKDAARFGLMLVEQSPMDSHSWLSVAPVLALASDEDAYRDFCSRMSKQFSQTENTQAAVHTCKVCLLLPTTLELAKLSAKPMTTSLEDGTTPRQLVGYRWGLKALLAYRDGDASLALDYVKKAEESNVDYYAQAQNLVIRALAENELGRLDDALKSQQEAAKVIAKLEENPANRSHRDVLMAQMLLRELQATSDKNATP